VGNYQLLERLRRGHADARAGIVHRCAPERSPEVPGRGEREHRPDQAARRAGSRHGETRGAALLPAFDAHAKAARRRIRCLPRQAGTGALRRQGGLRRLPRAAALHRARGNLHTADEIGIDDFQARRSPDGRYRTEPLRALWDTRKIHKGGYYHDGRFATLAEVVNHYDRHFRIQLTEQEKADLIEFLKSI
jgi:hypothetical protein